MITLYAVTWRDDAPEPRWEGLNVLADGDLAMVAGPTPAITNREDALSYGRTVEQVASAADVLPFRYDTTVADTDEARALLREHGSAWAARLQKVEGCAELAIRQLRRQRSRSARSRARSTWAGWSPEPAAERGRGRTGRPADRPVPGRAPARRHEELKLSCLVERPSVERVRSVLEEWASTRDDLVVSVTGPWAPYSFVADGEDAGVAL